MTRATVLGDAASRSAVRDDWRALAEAAGNAFLTPEWFDTWERHYGAGSGVVVAVHDDAGSLLGLLPLARSGRELRFAGSNVGDHFAPLARPGREDEVVRAAAGVLPGLVGRRPRLVLDNVDEDAAWLRTLTATCPGGLRPVRVLSSVLPYLPLRGRDWAGFLATRSRNFRSQLGRRERNLARDHDVRFRLADDPAALAKDMATFWALHDARWDARGGSSSQGDQVRAFHDDWASVALGRGWLRLWLLEVDGLAVAAWYGWHLGDRYCYYLAGFDPEWSDRSVGLVLLAHTVREAFAAGAGVYDLLLGDEEYKGRFADESDPVASVVLAGPLDPVIWKARATVGLRAAADRLPGDLRQSLRSVVRSANLTLPGARRR